MAAAATATAGAVRISDTVRELRGVASRLADMSPILEVVAANIIEKTDDAFDSSTSPTGEAWDGLSDATLEGRARRARGYTNNRLIGPLGPGERRRTAKRWNRRTSERVSRAVFNAKPLIDTGRLRSSISTRVTANSLEFGTNVLYAGALNFGNDANTYGGHAAPIPARHFLLVAQDGRTLEPNDFWRAQFALIERWLVTGEGS